MLAPYDEFVEERHTVATATPAKSKIAEVALMVNIISFTAKIVVGGN
jgi:hypothetical protein